MPCDLQSTLMKAFSIHVTACSAVLENLLKRLDTVQEARSAKVTVFY